jgi:hypothetical protein
MGGTHGCGYSTWWGEGKPHCIHPSSVWLLAAGLDRQMRRWGHNANPGVYMLPPGGRDGGTRMRAVLERRPWQQSPELGAADPGWLRTGRTAQAEGNRQKGRWTRLKRAELVLLLTLVRAIWCGGCALQAVGEGSQVAHRPRLNHAARVANCAGQVAAWVANCSPEQRSQGHARKSCCLALPGASPAAWHCLVQFLLPGANKDMLALPCVVHDPKWVCNMLCGHMHVRSHQPPHATCTETNPRPALCTTTAGGPSPSNQLPGHSCDVLLAALAPSRQQRVLAARPGRSSPPYIPMLL